VKRLLQSCAGRLSDGDSRWQTIEKDLIGLHGTNEIAGPVDLVGIESGHRPCPTKANGLDEGDRRPQIGKQKGLGAWCSPMTLLEAIPDTQETPDPKAEGLRHGRAYTASERLRPFAIDPDILFSHFGHATWGDAATHLSPDAAMRRAIQQTAEVVGKS
jgi:hypothetical protein